ncbi:hypothetical protein [Mycobacteroides abscessus]|uniref:hypothetical protein n=1 Tax=Mycobacteroides abscessus TaxID=36809 RepID=UPI001F26793B|nr:hypothetical protein [Mycobacteroides abscessus]
MAALPPSMLSNLMVSLEAVSPGIAVEILRSPSGALRRVPGMHNNVFTEVRERTGEASEKINRGKSDPMAVSKVQLASALCERGLIENGAIVDPLEAASELDRIETRIDAIASGAIVPPDPGTKFDELPPKVQNFYRRHTIDEITALTDVSQRMSDKLFDDVTQQAQVAAAPRRPDPIIDQIGADQAHVLTVGALMARADNGDNGVQIADGVTLARGESGNLSIAVDGLRLPVDSDTRIHELIARIPDVDFDQFTSVPAGGNSSGMNTVVQSMMVGKSPRALSMRLAAKRRVIERTFFGDTPMGYTMGADGQVHLLAGKARAHTAQRLASRPHSSRHSADEQAQSTRIEGFDVARNLRFARQARKQFVDSLPDALRAVRAPEVKLKRYAGSVEAEDRDAAARAGFQVRHSSNTLQADYPAARAPLAAVDWNTATAVPADPPGRALAPEHMDVRAEGARMVAAANQVARYGRNPELVSSDALVADAKLGQAFEIWNVARARSHASRVLTAVHPVPARYRGRDAQFVQDVFPHGGAFTTKGYTMARSDGAVRGGSGRVRVKYLTSDGMPVTGGDVIESGTTFRVVDTSVAADGTIEVRAVAEQVAAKMQQAATISRN